MEICWSVLRLLGFSPHIAKIIHMHYENQKVQIIKILKTIHNPTVTELQGFATWGALLENETWWLLSGFI